MPYAKPELFASERWQGTHGFSGWADHASSTPRNRPPMKDAKMRYRVFLVLLTALASASLAGGARAQQPGVAGQQAGAGATGVDSFSLRVDRARYKGSDSAPITIVEVSDFQCPYCLQWFRQTYRQVDSAYVRTGKVRFLYINNPLPRHPQAFAAAKAAACAGAQGKFWPMHDRLFSTQQEWSGTSDVARRFTQMAADLRLDPAVYRDCYENDRVAPLILSDLNEVSAAGIDGTPTFILNGRQALNGAVSFAEMRRAIEALLAAPAASAPARVSTPPRP
jgi:protein-disulfide isomerase